MTLATIKIDNMRVLKADEDVGFGWRLLSFKGKDAVNDAVLRLWANGLGIWDGAFGKPSARLDLTRAFNKVLNPKKAQIFFPKSNGIDPNKPPVGLNFRQRKWYDEKNKTLNVWAQIAPLKTSEIVNEEKDHDNSAEAFFLPNAEALPVAGIVIGVLVTAALGFLTAYVLNNASLTFSKAIEKLPIIGTATGTVKPITIGGYTLPVSSIATQTPQKPVVTGLADPPSAGQTLLDMSGNPWLWFGISLALLAGAVVLKQLRGAARDVGSGVGSVYSETSRIGEQFTSDPVSGKGRKGRR